MQHFSPFKRKVLLMKCGHFLSFCRYFSVWILANEDFSGMKIHALSC